MITKTGLIYSDNEDLSQGTYSGTIEEDGEVKTINLPDFPIGTTVYCKAYCINDGERIESNIENYTIEMPIEVDWFGIKNEYSGTNFVSITRSNDTDISTAASYLEYSKNGEDWTKTTTSTRVTLDYGETLYIRGDDSGYLSGKNGSTYVYWTLSGSENHSTVGNIMTLLKYSQEAGLTDYSFYFLFNGDSKLISPPALPATTLASNCYNSMFNACTGLTTPPALPATTLASNCYNNMFKGCTSLTKSPVLPATTLVNYCYNSMFNDCTGLTTPPALPATELAEGCYSAMFADCTALNKISSLPATTLASNCYNSMFRGCIGLTSVPTDLLPATTLATYCYDSMFENCTGLTSSPTLPAKTLENHCYYQMFNGCTSLNTVTTYADDIGDSYYTLYEWLKNVAETGTFYNIGSATYTVNSTRGIPVGWTEVKELEPEVDYFYIENTFEGTNTLTLTSTITGSPSADLYSSTVEYSNDKENWTTVNFDTSTPATITMSAGEKVYFRNDSGKFNYYGSTSESFYTSFKTTEDCASGGDLRSILKYSDIENIGLSQGCFYNLFNGFNKLKTVPKFPATTLARNCYREMFKGCSSITTPPELPATTMTYECYYHMFYGCSSLTVAPTLPATTLADRCYRELLRDCISITTPPELPATTLAPYCYYNMFKGCTSLTKSPVLPATTLVNYCYSGMFNSCSSLNEVTTYANDISASNCINGWLYRVAETGTFYNLGSATYTVNSQSGIPTGWTEVVPIPEVDYFYIENTFEGTNTLTLTSTITGSPSADSYSSSVEYSTDKTNWTTINFDTSTPATITMSAGEKVYFRNDSGRFNYYDFMDKFITSFKTTEDCASGGDLRSLLNYEDVDNVVLTQGCFYSLFNGFSKLKTVPKLPATTLAPYCYSDLFRDCSSLTTVPEDLLPATTLVNSCYIFMFCGCTGLTSTPSLPATTLASNCYNYMFALCSSIKSSPTLPAPTLQLGCYSGMFYSCSSLNEVTTYADDISADNCIGSWLYGVSATGTFNNLGSAEYPEGESGIPTGWTVVNS